MGKRVQTEDVVGAIYSLPPIIKYLIVGAVIFQFSLFLLWGKMASNERKYAHAEKMKYE